MFGTTAPCPRKAILSSEHTRIAPAPGSVVVQGQPWTMGRRNTSRSPRGGLPAERLANCQPKSSIVQLHFWPSLLYALFSIFLAHWVNRLPPTEVDDPTFRATLDNWLTAFTWIFVVFLVFQIVFAMAAVRSIWQNRNAVVQS